MRGSDEICGTFFDYIDPEKRVRSDHPLRVDSVDRQYGAQIPVWRVRQAVFADPAGVGLQQVKPINHLSRFVRNSYKVSTLPYAGRQGSSIVVPGEIEGTALTCRAWWPCYERVRVVFLGF